jgi:putative transposase
MNKRKSTRLPEYDYSEPGGYFITIVAHDRERLFGEIVDGEMVLNVFGVVAKEEWFKTGKIRPYVELFDEDFIVMPDHIHGVLSIV